MRKNILISGASKGIGLAIALELHKTGHTVIGTSRKPEQVEALPFKLIPLDVIDDRSVTACVEAALSQLSHIDVLINNAGFDLYAAAEDAGVVETVAQMNINTDTLETSIRGVAKSHPAYREQSLAMIKQLREMGYVSAVTPEQVARTVSKVIENNRPKLRYPVGKQARTVPLLKRLLPQRWFERFMLRQFMTVQKKLYS